MKGDGRKSTRVPTPENWHPTAEDGKVEVSFIPLMDGKYRVCVWGDDDFGMEKDFDKAEDAEKLYKAITDAAFITVAGCRALKMWNA